VAPLLPHFGFELGPNPPPDWAQEAPSFLGSLKDILTILAPGEKGEADLTGTKCKLNLRFEDADKQGLLHKLAKVKFNELPDMDKKNTYGACCNTCARSGV
tara:strand:- start:22 stop:324 length:303 start_codon:yes stop_codon:yes gene_type:complete